MDFARVQAALPYVIAGVGFLVGVITFTFVFPAGVETYKALRGSLFTGFFTVAGFLLSAKTLVILNMKKEIYEKENYLLRIHATDWAHTPREKKVNKSPRDECGVTADVYRPLSEVGTLLSVNIVLALIASFSQITLGLAETCTAIVVCLSVALSTAFLLACSVFLMWLNFRSLYADWERQAQEQLSKQWDKSLTEFHANTVTPNPATLPIAPTAAPGSPLPVAPTRPAAPPSPDTK